MVRFLAAAKQESTTANASLIVKSRKPDLDDSDDGGDDR